MGKEVMAKSRITQQFAATKSESTLLVLFIPSVDRHHAPINQDTWVDKALEVLGKLFGGATAFPRARGVWRDDTQGGRLIFDEPVVIQCYTSETALERHAPALREFLVDLGQQTNQGAVGVVIDRDYLEIQFPLKEPPRGKKRS
jgi:hypothetical protein